MARKRVAVEVISDRGGSVVVTDEEYRKHGDTLRITPIEFWDCVLDSYIQYAVDTTSRNIPRIEDGMRLVTRRILHVLKDYTQDVKSITVVGKVLGEYHPQGDAACYGALVTMGSISSEPWVATQGNWGSRLEGDKAAAMRYTECKVHKNYLKYLDSETMAVTPKVPNFDNTKEEPYFIVTKIPLGLVNHFKGLGVGYVAHIPAHNLGEVIEASIATIKSGYNIKAKQLAKIIKGPDHTLYPCNYLIEENEWLNIVENGIGSVKSTIAYEWVENDTIRITAIPYNTTLDYILSKINKLLEKYKCVDEDDIIERSADEKVDIKIRFKRSTPKAMEENNEFIEELIRSSAVNVHYKINTCSQIPTENMAIGDGTTWEIFESGLCDIFNEHGSIRRKYKLIALKEQIMKIDRDILLEKFKLEISKDPDKFFGILKKSETTVDAVSTCVNEYKFEFDIVDTVIRNTNFTAFINKNEETLARIHKYEEQRKLVQSRIDNVDDYMIEELKALVPKERYSMIETFKLEEFTES